MLDEKIILGWDNAICGFMLLQFGRFIVRGECMVREAGGAPFSSLIANINLMFDSALRVH